MAALWDVATVEERSEMVAIVLEPGGLYYDLENKIIAALKPRPAFLPVLRMLNGIVEFDETRGLLVTDHWCERNRRASDNPQDTQRDRQTRSTTFSHSAISVFLCSPLIQNGYSKWPVQAIDRVIHHCVMLAMMAVDSYRAHQAPHHPLPQRKEEPSVRIHSQPVPFLLSVYSGLKKSCYAWQGVEMNRNMVVLTVER